jgi:ABC-2 type transport system permease protein
VITAADLRNGLHRGRVEVRHEFRGAGRWLSQLVNPLALLAVTAALPGGGTRQLVVTGGVCTLVGLTGMVALTQALANDRDDGTLLRLRCTPRAFLPYVVARTVVSAVTTGFAVAVVLIGGALLLSVPLTADPLRWAAFAGVLALGFAATAPVGALLGALLPNPRTAVALVMLAVLALCAVSGLFVPLSALPGWLQPVADVSPLTHVGIGVRAALLPTGATSADLGDVPLSLAVLAAWALASPVLAARALRRASRKASGSRLQAARERAQATA